MYSNHSHYSLRSHNLSGSSTPSKLSSNFGLLRPKPMSTNPTPEQQQQQHNNMFYQYRYKSNCMHQPYSYGHGNTKSENNYNSCREQQYDYDKSQYRISVGSHARNNCHKLPSSLKDEEHSRDQYRVRKTKNNQQQHQKIKTNQHHESTQKQKHNSSKTEDNNNRTVYSIHNKRPSISGNASESKEYPSQSYQASRSRSEAVTQLLQQSKQNNKILRIQRQIQLPLASPSSKVINNTGEENANEKLMVINKNPNNNISNNSNKMSKRVGYIEQHCDIDIMQTANNNNNPEQCTIKQKYHHHRYPYPNSMVGSIKRQYQLNQQQRQQQQQLAYNKLESKQLPLCSSSADVFDEVLTPQSSSSLQSRYQKDQQPNKTNTSTNININKKKVGGYSGDVLHCQKQLINQLNSSTQYVRYKHRHKLMQRKNQVQVLQRESSRQLEQYQSIYTSKHTQTNPMLKFELDCAWTISDIMKLVHYPIYDHNSMYISIKIPLFFQQMPSVFLQDSQLRFKAMMLMQQAGINVHYNQSAVQIIKQKQSLVFIYAVENEERYCLAWYPDGSVYMGQSVNAVRHGKGLQWVPGLYVYIGQYQDNMRHGYGIMKRSDRVVYAGLWQHDIEHGYGRVIAADGTLWKDALWRNGTVVKGNTNNGYAELT